MYIGNEGQEKNSGSAAHGRNGSEVHQCLLQIRPKKTRQQLLKEVGDYLAEDFKDHGAYRGHQWIYDCVREGIESWLDSRVAKVPDKYRLYENLWLKVIKWTRDECSANFRAQQRPPGTWGHFYDLYASYKVALAAEADGKVASHPSSSSIVGTPVNRSSSSYVNLAPQQAQAAANCEIIRKCAKKLRRLITCKDRSDWSKDEGSKIPPQQQQVAYEFYKTDMLDAQQLFVDEVLKVLDRLPQQLRKDVIIKAVAKL